MNFKIVSPNDGEWRDYSTLVVSNDVSLLENVFSIRAFESEFEFSQLNKPVDRSLWFMNPHDVNAYYSPNYNEIVFPAGILQGDFFGDNMVKNFGGIGVVIGHEITHGFDDEGRKFDCDGNLVNWFTDDDVKRFESRSVKLERQFDKLSIEGLRLNGKLTLGENIADLGGVVISYNAMNDYMERKGGVSDEDRKNFFTSFAKVWKCKATPESTKLRVTTDPHSPPEYRVNQILGNFQPFLDLFEIEEEDDMYIREDNRAIIW
jgi:putative endopeptidase